MSKVSIKFLNIMKKTKTAKSLCSNMSEERREADNRDI